MSQAVTVQASSPSAGGPAACLGLMYHSLHVQALWQVLGLMARHGGLLRPAVPAAGPSSTRGGDGPASVSGAAPEEAAGVTAELADVLTVCTRPLPKYERMSDFGARPYPSSMAWMQTKFAMGLPIGHHFGYHDEHHHCRSVDILTVCSKWNPAHSLAGFQPCRTAHVLVVLKTIGPGCTEAGTRRRRVRLFPQAAGGWPGGGGALLLPRPADGALVAAAAEVQRLLLAGRRADALRCICHRHFDWTLTPALVWFATMEHLSGDRSTS